MTDQQDAVILLLDRLRGDGIKWFREAMQDDLDLLERRITGNFKPFEGLEIQTIGRKPKGNFPAKRILLMQPSRKEAEAVLGLWLIWNFEADPIEFRLFVGQWAKIDKGVRFACFRFETPELGDEHDYFHCQPCNNFGDREPVPGAAPISQRFPTIPMNASNIVELTICALMATMGRKKMKEFVQKLLRVPAAASNEVLLTAYYRCCKEPFVHFTRTTQ